MRFNVTFGLYVGRAIDAGAPVNDRKRAVTARKSAYLCYGNVQHLVLQLSCCVATVGETNRVGKRY